MVQGVEFKTVQMTITAAKIRMLTAKAVRHLVVEMHKRYSARHKDTKKGIFMKVFGQLVVCFLYHWTRETKVHMEMAIKAVAMYRRASSDINEY